MTQVAGQVVVHVEVVEIQEVLVQVLVLSMPLGCFSLSSSLRAGDGILQSMPVAIATGGSEFSHACADALIQQSWPCLCPACH